MECNFAGAYWRTHHGTEKDVNSNHPKRRTVILYRKRSAVIFIDAADQAHVKAAHEHPLSRELDSRWRMDIVNKNEVRFLPVVRLVFGFPRARGVMSFLNFHRYSL